ncbi:RHS repeat-associated core domain-containing protein (plasmid) [Leptospira noguchii]|uniref:RHS repeat-associated core domain-containing protein n=1 Tax=Leptospira noguchii TaxID=28182 RepID=A0AAE9KAT8_9LEPT|nr:RHS repeat-associated core domain-containing protein [Leptospira noguchii]UOG58933.1 RHS repeat-associated core domain-containing protein [Leptospira noguchii]
MKIAVVFCISIFAFNLLTGAESPVSEKLERSSNVEYNKTLKHKTTFLRKPPYLLIPNHSPLETYDESGFRIRRSALEPKNNQFTNVEILYPSKFFGLEFIESENVITSVNNVYLNGVRIAALNEAGALAYYLTDQVDSVSTVLDDEGNTLSQMQYLPYGETFVQRGDLNFSPKYNSQELDRESGFYFFNARYYDPGIARFTSADTIIDGEFDTQGWNRFSYVKGNPIGAKDPTGHCSVVSTVQCKTHLELGGGGVPPVGKPGSSGGGNSAGLGATVTGLLANLLGSKDDKPSLPDKPRSTSATPSEAKDMSKAGLDPLNKSDVKNFLDKGNKSGVTHGGNSATNNKTNASPFEAKNTSTTSGYRYVTKGEVQAIKDTGILRGGREGETYFTKDLYKSGSKAQERLSLKDQPTHRVEFEISGKPNYEKYGSKVDPLYGQPGKGSEFMTTDPVKVKLINIQPLR